MAGVVLIKIDWKRTKEIKRPTKGEFNNIDKMLSSVIKGQINLGLLWVN